MPVSRTRKPRNKSKAAARDSRADKRAPREPGAATGGRRLAAGALALALVCVLVIGALSALSGSGGDDPAGGGDGPTVEPLPSDHPALALARREDGDPLAIGDTDAPVVMIEYADFQDAFAGIHARDTHDSLVAEYVESGVLRIEFRNFPVNGPESDAAARASWAAGRQGRFWEFSAVAFGEEFNHDSGRFSADGLRELATEAGVPDLDRFAEDTESPEAGDAVGRDAEEALDLGVTTTPAFLINGQALQGARPVEDFRDIIDQLAGAAEEDSAD
ncbi:DsbA family protein [Streptomyces sp. NBC_01803]|uniref:DsbA family protein n=1 Tax=Streptomyces sp. NBC_01803 TaxID=2975946 RepID=UPI002DD8D5A1|nr:DsbA family protein [Streptomyces sp. NBC_01803]WSA45851.1 DsbA family protein [Streptomyces sp. NBC_01803]